MDEMHDGLESNGVKFLRNESGHFDFITFQGSDIPSHETRAEGRLGYALRLAEANSATVRSTTLSWCL